MSRPLKTQREINGLYEMTDEAIATVVNSPYYNHDLAATKIKQRTWGTYNITALWVGMCICIPTYMMAAGIMAGGLTWWEALLNIFLGNLIVLIPMQLNSHAGTKYGIPYPVFARLAFGIKGSYIAAMARAIIGAGWFGIQCWIGGEAIHVILSTITPGFAAWSGAVWVSFFAFWGLNVYVAYKGPETIKFLEAYSVPILVVISLSLMGWAYSGVTAKGLGIADIFNMPVKRPENFALTFLEDLTANIAFWATLALNIPDFSRFAKSQKAQYTGQALGLPLTMLAFSFVGVFVTGATKIIFGEFVWDPVQVIVRMHSPVASILGGLGIIVATLNMNIAANVVATSNDISNLNPQKISFKRATLITGVAGIAIMPWKLLSSASAFIFGWLGTYGILLGPLAGIYIADYYIHRKKLVDEHSLFSGPEGRYWYKNGFNTKAFVIWFIAAAIPMIGKFVPSLKFLSDGGWILGFLIGMIIYTYASKNETVSLLSEEENAKITIVEAAATTNSKDLNV